MIFYNYATDSLLHPTWMTIPGSMGGTYVTLVGSGFGISKAENSVMIGDNACEITSASETGIICKAPKQSLASKLYITLTINGIVSPNLCECASGENAPATSSLTTTSSSLANGCCSFEYLSSMTPTITNVSVYTPDSIIITGTLFSTNLSDNVVSVGPFSANASSSNSTHLIVSVADVPAGTHLVDVFVNGLGFANGSETAGSYTVTPSINSVTPGKSSISGGASVTIAGTGFDYTNPTANKVELCYSECVVKTATATAIVCTSGALVTSANADIGELTVPLNVNNCQASYQFVFCC